MVGDRPVLYFVVPVVPVAQPRQNQGVRMTAQGPKAINFLDAKHPVNAYKAALGLIANRAMRGQALFDGPLYLSLAFYLPRPARLMGNRFPDGPLLHVAKPDLDNLVKSTKDALKGIVWRDDATVCGYVPPFGKWYHEKQGYARAEVAIYRQEEERR